jgi:hypothetical protein
MPKVKPLIGGKVTVSSHTRRTKKGKITTVKTHTRSQEKAMQRADKVRSLYTKIGVPPPKTDRAIHSVAFHKRATAIMAGMMKRKGIGAVDKNLAYALAMKQIGYKRSVLKAHKRK